MRSRALLISAGESSRNPDSFGIPRDERGLAPSHGGSICDR